MNNLVLVFGCMGLGFALGRLAPPSIAKRGVPALNRLAIQALLPCLAFFHLQSLGPFTRSYWLPVAMPWLVLSGSLVFFGGMARLRGWSRPTWGALVLTAGLGNTSFVGFPLLEALRGTSSLQIGVLADQFGTFLALATAGSFLVAVLTAKGNRITSVLGRIAAFPPLLAAALGLGLRGVALPAVFLSAIGWLGHLLSPVALLSVGMQLGGIRGWGSESRKLLGPLLAGLGYKLVLAPAGILVLYLGVFGQRGSVAGISVLEAAMAPMVTGAVMAADAGLAPELSGLLIGVGVPLSLLSVPIWNSLLVLLGA
jgi:predicted permease